LLDDLIICKHHRVISFARPEIDDMSYDEIQPKKQHKHEHTGNGYRSSGD